MRTAVFFFLITAIAQASSWEKIFKSTPFWEEASVISVAGRTIQYTKSQKGLFFTNASKPKAADYLQTSEKYGDCTVEAEFLIPEGSNSGIYLMGRYEIQILDSHGKAKAGAGDMGGVYQRWDPERTPKGFEGVAPLVNAAKPAGEWQHLVIKFKAPKFDEQGELSGKPVFLEVILNGQIVQKNVTVNGPTRSAQRDGFTAKDHIFIQGDHGPIVFRKFLVTKDE